MFSAPARQPRLFADQYQMASSYKLENLLGRNEAQVFALLASKISTWGEWRDGQQWLSLSIGKIQREELTSFTRPTLTRIFKRLRARGVLLATRDYNEAKWDKTYWYAINADQLAKYDIEYLGNRAPLPEPMPEKVAKRANPLSRKQKKVYAKINAELGVREAFWEFVNALADLTCLDFGLHKSTLFTQALDFWKQGYRREDLSYVADYWYSQDARGMAGRYPTLKQVTQVIRQAQVWAQRKGLASSPATVLYAELLHHLPPGMSIHI